MLAVNPDNFQEEVLEHKGIALVDFWSPSCKPCMELLPRVEEMEAEYPAVKFAKVDVSKARRLTISQKVSALPTLIVYKDGQAAELLSGPDATADAVESMLGRFI